MPTPKEDVYHGRAEEKEFAQEKEFNQDVAWSIFETFAQDTKYESFNVVADYRYHSLDSFYQSAVEFVRAKKKFKKELEKEFNAVIK